MSKKKQEELNELAIELLGDGFTEVSKGHLEEKEIEKGEQFGYRKQS